MDLTTIIIGVAFASAFGVMAAVAVVVLAYQAWDRGGVRATFEYEVQQEKLNSLIDKQDPGSGSYFCGICGSACLTTAEMAVGLHDYCAKHNAPKPWAKEWHSCIDCGTTDRPHHACGFCARCYQQMFPRPSRAKSSSKR